MLTRVDEFSRFPFAFPCASIDAKTVITCLNQLFAISGLPSYVHSDRAATFTSSELSSYFLRRSIIVVELLCTMHLPTASASGTTESFGRQSD